MDDPYYGNPLADVEAIDPNNPFAEQLETPEPDEGVEAADEAAVEGQDESPVPPGDSG
jgi:hypothetical protein